MTTKQQIDHDLKQAMLAGEKQLVSVLRGLKSVILYAEVAEGKRDEGLNESTVTSLLQKEAKKRQESADLYRQGGDAARATQEESEKAIIERYLPEQLTEEEITELVKQEIATQLATSPQQMGAIISAVKQKTAGAADGALIARVAKELLS